MGAVRGGCQVVVLLGNVVAAFVTRLVVSGGGGLAVAQGVRLVTGFVTGNESGDERLAAPVSVTDQGVTLASTVDNVPGIVLDPVAD